MLTSEEYAKIIAKNLKRIAYESKRTQADISRDLHISKATVSSWMVGTRCPRMKHIDMLCNYFNVSREEIMEEDPKHRRDHVTVEELELLRLFRLLSDEGRAAALERVEEMADMPKWKKDGRVSSRSEAV